MIVKGSDVQEFYHTHRSSGVFANLSIVLGSIFEDVPENFRHDFIGFFFQCNAWPKGEPDESKIDEMIYEDHRKFLRDIIKEFRELIELYGLADEIDNAPQPKDDSDSDD